MDEKEEVGKVIRLDDRIDIFRNLTADEATDHVKHEIFRGLLDEYYDDFVNFCNEIEDKKDHVKSVSCHIADKQIYFEVKCDDEINE